MNISTLIRAWRHHEELSIREAAVQIGIDRNALFRLENGKAINEASLRQLLRWALG